jgi:tetratricopeptide (TPR) repeat protein
LNEAVEAANNGLICAATPLQKAKLYLLLAVANKRLTRHTDAHAALTTARYHYKQAGCVEGLAIVSNNLANLLFDEGRFSAARHHAAEACELFTACEEEVWLAQSQETLARILLAQRLYVEAYDAASASVRTLGTARDCGIASIADFDESARTQDKAREQLRANVARCVAESVIRENEARDFVRA